jgi:hypothetical protein
MGPAGAETARGVARGHLQQRVDGGRRDPAVLVLLDEAVLHAEFRVARSRFERTAVGLVEGQPRLEMQLNVGQAAIIAVARRRDATRVPHLMRSQGEGV